MREFKVNFTCRNTNIVKEDLNIQFANGIEVETWGNIEKYIKQEIAREYNILSSNQVIINTIIIIF